MWSKRDNYTKKISWVGFDTSHGEEKVSKNSTIVLAPCNVKYKCIGHYEILQCNGLQFDGDFSGRHISIN